MFDLRDETSEKIERKSLWTHICLNDLGNGCNHQYFFLVPGFIPDREQNSGSHNSPIITSQYSNLDIGNL